MLEGAEEEVTVVLDSVEWMTEDEEGLESVTITTVEEEDQSDVIDVSIIEEVEDERDVARGMKEEEGPVSATTEVKADKDVVVVAGSAAEAVDKDGAAQGSVTVTVFSGHAQGIEPGMATAPPMRKLAAIWSFMARSRS